MSTFESTVAEHLAFHEARYEAYLASDEVGPKNARDCQLRAEAAALVTSVVCLLDDPEALTSFRRTVLQDVTEQPPLPGWHVLTSVEAVADIASVIATEAKHQVSQADVVRATSLTHGHVSRSLKELRERRYTLPGIIPNRVLGRRTTSTVPSKKFAVELARNPDWIQATRFRQLQNSWGLSAQATYSRLLDLGHQATS